MTLMAALHYFVSSTLNLEILHRLILVTIQLYLPQLLRGTLYPSKVTLPGHLLPITLPFLCTLV